MTLKQVGNHKRHTQCKSDYMPLAPKSQVNKILLKINKSVIIYNV